LLIVLGVHFFAANDNGLGIPSPTRQKGRVINRNRLFRPFPLALMLLFGVSGVAVVAQIEGGAERGVVPTDNQSSYEVNDIMVDVYGKTADQARFMGWREAQRKGWRQLWQKTHGGGGAPALGDATLDSMVSGIIIEDEQIGPNRYIARLGVLFDRVRAGQILGVSGNYSRSAPLLVLPVQWSGGAAQTFEQRTEWQKAWARFRAGQSPIDYVRPAGTGSDPLLLNAAQAGRRGRTWWRALLDQYGAADVLIPQARLERLYPDGPVTGYFSARYGPDNRLLQNFQLRAESTAGIPAMLDAAVKRIDEIYGDALASGKLAPDPSLIIEEPMTEEEREAAEKAAEEAREAAAANSDAPKKSSVPVETVADDDAAPTNRSITTITVPFDTPDIASVGAAEAAVRNIPGVRSASTTSLALGGTSMMRVSFEGDPDVIRRAISARTTRAPAPVVERKPPEPAQPELTDREKRKLEKEREKQEKKERKEREKREREEQRAREKAAKSRDE
jgi:hypothetical protein